MMRYMRDSGYLAMLSASDRQRLLLFFITLRITASTQEAIACLFESSPPQLAEQMLAQVGVRLLRFSLSTMYWRRAISGLANPYLRALSVFGLGALPLSQEGALARRALEVELLIRGEAQLSLWVPEAVRKAVARRRRGGSLTLTMHEEAEPREFRTGDLLFLWDGAPLTAAAEQAAPPPAATTSKTPTLAVVVRIDSPRAPPLILYMTYEPTALKRGVRRIALASLSALKRIATVRRITIRRLLGVALAAPRPPDPPAALVKTLTALKPKAPAPPSPSKRVVKMPTLPKPPPRGTKPPRRYPSSSAVAAPVPAAAEPAAATTATSGEDTAGEGGAGTDGDVSDSDGRLAAPRTASEAGLMMERLRQIVANQPDAASADAAAAPAEAPPSPEAAPAFPEAASSSSLPPNLRLGSGDSVGSGVEADDGGLIKPQYVCPITHCLMMEPVFTADGQTYEKKDIEQWLENHDTSPLTGDKLANKTLVPNFALRQLIHELLEAHPELLDQHLSEAERPEGGAASSTPAAAEEDPAAAGLTRAEGAALRGLLGELLGAHEPDDDEAPEGSEAVVGELVRAGFALGDVGEALASVNGDAPAALDVLFAGVSPVSIPPLLAAVAPPADAPAAAEPAPEPGFLSKLFGGGSGAGSSSDHAAAPPEAAPPDIKLEEKEEGPEAAAAAAAASAAQLAELYHAAGASCGVAPVAAALEALLAEEESGIDEWQMSGRQSEAGTGGELSRDEILRGMTAQVAAALYESLQLLPSGVRHVLAPADFLETGASAGAVDRKMLKAGAEEQETSAAAVRAARANREWAKEAWLAPQQTARLLSGGAARTAWLRAPKPSEVELFALLGRSVAGRAIVKAMADSTEEMPLPPIERKLERHVILTHVQTGDLVLLQAKGFCGRFLSHALRCPWAHMGVVVRLPALPHVPLLLEAEPVGNPAAEPEGPPPMQLVDLRSRLAGWIEAGCRPVVRRLVRPPRAPPLDTNALVSLAATGGRGRPELGAAHPAAAGAPGPSSATGSRAKIGLNHTRALLEAMYGPAFVARFATLNARDGIASLQCAEGAPRPAPRLPPLRVPPPPLPVPPPRSPPAAASAPQPSASRTPPSACSTPPATPRRSPSRTSSTSRPSRPATRSGGRSRSSRSARGRSA